MNKRINNKGMDNVKYNGNRKMKRKLVDNIDKNLKVEIKKNSDE